MTKTVLLAGASGLVGSKILEVLDNNNVKIISLARNKFHSDSNIEEIICDFNEIDALTYKIKLDEVYVAIGKPLKLYELLYLRKSERSAFRKVDFDFIRSIALFAKKNGAKSIGIVSAIGANDKSKNTYLKVKGEIEKEIISLGFQKIVIAQPGHLLGKRKDEKLLISIFEKITYVLGYLMVGPLKKFRNINASKVAKSIVLKMDSNERGICFLDFDDFTNP